MHSRFSRLSRFLRLTAVTLVALVWSSPAFCDEIHDAATAGDLGKVKALLKRNPALVFSKDERGWTPLHDAAAKGHADVAELLLANQAEVTAKKDDGMTPLHVAAFNGKKNVAELLLANKADVNAKASGDATPLQYAAAKGYKDVTELLLANYADVNAKDNAGMTPLHLAASEGHKDVAELLLANHAEVNPEDNDGDTPLHLALETNHNDVAELLRGKGGQDLTSPPSTPFAILHAGGECWTLADKRNIRVIVYKIDEKGPKEFGMRKGLAGSFNSKKNGDFKVDLAPGLHTLLVLYSQFFFNVHGYALNADVSFVAKAGHSYNVCYIPDAYGLPSRLPSPVLNNTPATGIIPSKVALVVVDDANEKIVSKH